MPVSDAKNPAEKWNKLGLILFLAGLAMLYVSGRLDQSAQSRKNRAVNHARRKLEKIEGDISRSDRVLLEKLAATNADAAKLLQLEKEEIESLAEEEGHIFGQAKVIWNDDQFRYRDAQAVQQKIKFAQQDQVERRKRFLDTLGLAAGALSPDRAGKYLERERLRREILDRELKKQTWLLRMSPFLALGAIFSGLALLLVWLFRRSR